MKRLAWTSALLLVAGCASVPRVTPELAASAQARWPESDQADLEAGRELYVRRCSACHALDTPADRSEAQWTEQVHKMQRKAKIDDDQRERILRFLIVARTAPKG